MAVTIKCDEEDYQNQFATGIAKCSNALHGK